MDCIKLVIFELLERIMAQNIVKVLIFDKSVHMRVVFKHVIIQIFCC